MRASECGGDLRSTFHSTPWRRLSTAEREAVEAEAISPADIWRLSRYHGLILQIQEKKESGQRNANRTYPTGYRILLHYEGSNSPDLLYGAGWFVFGITLTASGWFSVTTSSEGLRGESLPDAALYAAIGLQTGGLVICLLSCEAYSPSASIGLRSIC